MDQETEKQENPVKGFSNKLVRGAVRQAMKSGSVRDALTSDAVRRAAKLEALRDIAVPDSLRQKLHADALGQKLNPGSLRDKIDFKSIGRKRPLPGTASPTDMAAPDGELETTTNLESTAAPPRTAGTPNIPAPQAPSAPDQVLAAPV